MLFFPTKKHSGTNLINDYDSRSFNTERQADTQTYFSPTPIALFPSVTSNSCFVDAGIPVLPAVCGLLQRRVDLTAGRCRLSRRAAGPDSGIGAWPSLCRSPCRPCRRLWCGSPCGPVRSGFSPRCAGIVRRALVAFASAAAARYFKPSVESLHDVLALIGEAAPHLPLWSAVASGQRRAADTRWGQAGCGRLRRQNSPPAHHSRFATCSH